MLFLILKLEMNILSKRNQVRPLLQITSASAQRRKQFTCLDESHFNRYLKYNDLSILSEFFRQALTNLEPVSYNVLEEASSRQLLTQQVQVRR